MSKTVDDLMEAFRTGFRQRMQGPGIRPEGDIAIRAGIIAVVTALRDEILRDYGGNNHSWCERVALGAINEILAPREGGQAAVCQTCKGAGALFGPYDASDVTPCPECTPAAPAPVCEWTQEGWEYRTAGCNGWSVHIYSPKYSPPGNKCPHCKAPIKFTEAK